MNMKFMGLAVPDTPPERKLAGTQEYMVLGLVAAAFGLTLAILGFMI